jgi:ribosomal protein L37AE/L43A
MTEEDMSTQVGTIAPLPSAETQSPLYRGIAITGAVAFPAASAFSILFALNRSVDPFVFSIASAAGMGLILGWISRLTLPQRSAPIRWLVTLFGLSIGMTFLGWLTWGALGMDLIDRTTRDPYWEGLFRLACGAVISLLTVRAWTARAISDVGTLPRLRERARVKKTTPTITKPRVRKLRRRRPKLQLNAQVEHRCPYCLEIVETKDPRGIKVCPICHAVHHADCWAVTGMCQVPHHNG